MNKFMKKVLVGVMAATMMLGSVATAYAATGSATTAPEPSKQTEVKADKNTTTGITATVNTSKNGAATITEIKATSKKTVTISSTVKVDGVKYTVTKIAANAFENATKATKIELPKTITTIGANAFAGADKVKTIKITSTETVKVSKTAFKGVDTKKMTITVKVSAKGMSSAEYKAFVKALKAAGFKGTIKKVK